MSSIQLYKQDKSLPNHVAESALEFEKDVNKPNQAEYGVDSPFGFVVSFPFTPLYAYATLKGKFTAWDDILQKLPSEVFDGPTLDAGCGRGMVLIKTAQIKKEKQKLSSASPAVGIDIFSSLDQTGNTPYATSKNICVEGLQDGVVLNTANFTDLPFADNVFSLVTSSLALHNPSTEERRLAIIELGRVMQPQGTLVILDLAGFRTTRMYAKTLKELGWEDVKCEFAGMGCVFGVLPCHIVTARKPKWR